MTSITASRLAGWLSCAMAFTAAAAPTVTRAQEAQATKLETLVVSATRSPQDAATTPSSVSVVSVPDLAASQVSDLRTALAETPGLFVANTGAVGGQSSIFLRGARSDQTLIVVDGIRMNDRSASYQNFLSGADVAGLDRIEVLRGPQGTLYGSSAMGGVILLETTHGSGSPLSVFDVEGGSFVTREASASIKGGFSDFGYSGSIGRLMTANDRAFNHDKQWTYSTRLEGNVASNVLLGVTFRGIEGNYEEPGSTLYPAPGVVDSDSYLTTAYAQVRVTSGFTSRLTAGWTKQDYTFTTNWGASNMRHTRRIADLQNTWVACKQAEVVFGAERTLGENMTGTASTGDNSTAFYASSVLHPEKDTTVTLGARNDHFSTFGEATTWRAATSYQFRETATVIRASYGTGFTAPSSDDRFGVPSWNMLPNANLVPEKSRGWEVGVTQSFLGDRLTTEATYFRTQYRNILDWQTVDYTTYAGKTVNLARALTKGLEFAVNAKFTKSLSARLAYTYLEADDDTTGVRLTRRPRHVGDAEIRANITKDWMAGVGVHVVADRLEGVTPVEDYTTVRVFTSYDLGLGVSLKLRAENLLNEKYQEVLGYPALPFGFYAGLEWRY